MVATLVLQLVAQHRVDLADSVEKWLPGLVPNGSAITVRMLLNHTSGLFNDPLFAPGQEYCYSNTGYVVLGLIVQRATGHSVADLGVRQAERLGDPLLDQP
jgi:D-alanyl-D-alanine carboxypeptidase